MNEKKAPSINGEWIRGVLCRAQDIKLPLFAMPSNLPMDLPIYKRGYLFLFFKCFLDLNFLQIYFQKMKIKSNALERSSVVWYLSDYSKYGPA